VGEPEPEWVHTDKIKNDPQVPFRLPSGNIPDTSKNNLELRYVLDKSGENSFFLVDMQGKMIYQQDLKEKPTGEYSLPLINNNKSCSRNPFSYFSF
jgi:hypothetical protein